MIKEIAKGTKFKCVTEPTGWHKGWYNAGDIVYFHGEVIGGQIAESGSAWISSDKDGNVSVSMNFGVFREHFTFV